MSTKRSWFSVEGSVSGASVTWGTATIGASARISSMKGVLVGAGGLSVATIVGVILIVWQANTKRDISAIITNNLLLLFIKKFLSGYGFALVLVLI
jgi:hypothetical protein